MNFNRYTLLVVLVGLTAITTFALAGDPPKKITLKTLENLYGPAVFDHEMHMGAAENCKSCHHKGFTKPMACKECHDEPVDKSKFNHEKHFEYDSCESCHQTKSTKNVACSTCHKIPYDKKNPAVSGLKGAFHGQCMNCHKENEVSNSCTFCHTKK